MIRFLFFVSGVLLTVGGTYIAFAFSWEYATMLGAALLTLGICLGALAFPVQMNSVVDTQKVVKLPKMRMRELCDSLQQLPTPLGRPWLCKIVSISQPVLVYGPDSRGGFIYGHWGMGMFYLSCSTDKQLLQPDKENRWRLNGGGQTRQEEAGILYEDHINLAGQLEAYQHLFEEYVRLKQAPDLQTVERIFGKAGKSQGKLYAFQEGFKLTGQRYSMIDLEGNALYDIEGTWPMKTLRIYPHDSNQVAFRVTKRILHVLPQYDFYVGEDEKLLGTFKKKLDLGHDNFTMKLGNEQLSMRSVAVTIGSNYIVRLGGRQIGTISENLSLTLHNLLFDNMVVEVFDEQYTLLMAALAIMSAREMARDEDDDDLDLNL